MFVFFYYIVLFVNRADAFVRELHSSNSSCFVVVVVVYFVHITEL